MSLKDIGLAPDDNVHGASALGWVLEWDGEGRAMGGFFGR